MNDKKLKVSEIFYSLQGEGKYTGTPSVFLRTFGCNFKCQGFSMFPKGTLSTEADKVAEQVDEYEKYEDLPLVSTGCDSYASWHPAFKKFSPLLTIDEVVDRVLQTLPYWSTWTDEHLIITGGEPLLAGWQKVYPDLLSHSDMLGLSALTFETNGTQPLSDDLHTYLCNWGHVEDITFSVSAKLSSSGEDTSKSIVPDVVCDYEDVGETYLKWVVSTDSDVEEALDFTNDYRNAGFEGDVYLMPVGGTEETFSLNKQNVAEMALKYGLKFSDRLQVSLWKNAWAT